MIVSFRILLSLLVALGTVSDSLQAGLRYGQRYTPIANVELEVIEIPRRNSPSLTWLYTNSHWQDPGTRLNITCHKDPGIPRKFLKPYFSDFCANHVHKKPGDVSNSEMEYALIEPWGLWKLKLTWSTKKLWMERNCEAYYKALAFKKACGTFRNERGRVVVAKEAHAEEHSGPEKCESSVVLLRLRQPLLHVA